MDAGENMAEESSWGLAKNLTCEGMQHLLIVAGHKRSNVKVLIITSCLKIVFISILQSSQDEINLLCIKLVVAGLL